MQNKILFFVAVALIPIVVISFYKKETNFNLVEKNNQEVIVRLKNVDNNEVTNISLEEYVIGVVAAEMPASFDSEALKAQAVASRTYAYYKIQQSNNEYDVVSDISDQGYINESQMQKKWGNDYQKYYEKISNAVKSTKNEILTYDGKVIIAYYFAMSNGYTEDSSHVFKEEPYLTSVLSTWDNQTINNFQVETVVSRDRFCKSLEISCNNIIIGQIERSSSNRINSIVINNKKVSGITVRKLLNLRSTDFDIKINNNEITITTYGYGHGVGMSQYGANGMALDGYNYDAILKHYYTDVSISKI